MSHELDELRFRGVSFRYPRASRDVLSDLDLTFGRGRTALLGPNGAGKSTVLALAAGARRPKEGSVDLGGASSGRPVSAELVGWMPQDVRPVPGLRVQEQVAYSGWLKGLDRRRAWESAAEALHTVELSDVAQEASGSLSGGQLRRVGLAEVLVTEPPVLLLDEPTSGLDPAQRSHFRSVLSGLGDDRVVVVATHLVDDLGDLFDRVVVLLGGVVLFQGSTGEFVSRGVDDNPARAAESAYTSITRGHGK